MNGSRAPWAPIAALLAALAAVATWWLVPPPAPPRQAPPHDEAWALPTLHASNPDKSLAALVVVSPWGKAAAGAGAPAATGQSEVVQNDPDWRFDGVTVNGAERRVLVRVAGQAATALKEGDALPGGAKILHIHDDSLCLLINGKKRNRDIFQ